jgi:hypothetical protein
MVHVSIEMGDNVENLTMIVVTQAEACGYQILSPDYFFSCSLIL